MLCGVLLMDQASLLDRLALDAFSVEQNGLAAAETDVSWGQVAQALVAAVVVVVVNENDVTLTSPRWRGATCSPFGWAPHHIDAGWRKRNVGARVGATREIPKISWNIRAIWCGERPLKPTDLWQWGRSAPTQSCL